MDLKDIERPKNVFVALVFSTLAWVVLQFLHSPGSERDEENK